MGIEINKTIDSHLPDSREISEIEDVVEFGWCGQHLNLGLLPEMSCRRDQGFHQLVDLVGEPSLLPGKRQSDILTQGQLDRLSLGKLTV